MKIINCLILLFFGLSCQNKNICSEIIYSIAENHDKSECIDLSDWYHSNWDKIHFISSNLYPDEIEKSTGIKYPYKMHFDPNKVILIEKEGEILYRFCGMCSDIYFSKKLTKNGIATISSEVSYCLIAKRMPTGHYYLSMKNEF